MTDRTAKFLANQKLRKWVKSWLQPVDNIEKADFVILQDPKSINASVIFKAGNFKRSVGVVYSDEELTHYVSLDRENKEYVVENFKPIKMGLLYKIFLFDFLKFKFLIYFVKNV